jgi:hypothetical protein
MYHSIVLQIFQFSLCILAPKYRDSCLIISRQLIIGAQFVLLVRNSFIWYFVPKYVIIVLFKSQKLNWFVAGIRQVISVARCWQKCLH